MKHLKNVLAIMMVAIMILSLAACSSSAGTTPSDAAAAAGERYEYTDDGRIIIRVADVLDNVDISMQGFIDAMNAYAEWLNAHRDDIYVELTHYDGQATVEKQISDIETAVAMGVNCMILHPVDNDGVYGATQEAMKAGVKVSGAVLPDADKQVGLADRPSNLYCRRNIAVPVVCDALHSICLHGKLFYRQSMEPNGGYAGFFRRGKSDCRSGSTEGNGNGNTL